MKWLNHLAEFVIYADVLDSEMVKVTKDYKSSAWVLSMKPVKWVHPNVEIEAVNKTHTQL